MKRQWGRAQVTEHERPDIETLGSRVVYSNNWMTVREDAIRRQDGSTGIYGVIDKPDFVVVVPLHADGSLQLVQQYRYPIKARCWEFPLGTWGPPGSDPALAGLHELKEETGLTAATLTHAGYLYAAPGTINQGYNVFLRHWPDRRSDGSGTGGAGHGQPSLQPHRIRGNAT